jgi:hypothetical protein
LEVPDEHLFIANSNPAAGREGDYNEWYETHLREVVFNIDGFVAGTRYRLSEQQRPDVKPSLWRYITLYELVGNDVDAIHESNRHVRESGVYSPYEGLIDDDHVGHVYSPVGEPYRVEGWSDRRDAAHIMVVRSNPVAGNEATFQDWYQNHLLEVMGNIHGYRGAQRYRLNASQRPGMPEARWQYVTIYELDEPDLEKVHRSNMEARERGAFTPWTGILTDDHVGHVFTPVSARVVDEAAAGVA